MINCFLKIYSYYVVATMKSRTISCEIGKIDTTETFWPHCEDAYLSPSMYLYSFKLSDVLCIWELRNLTSRFDKAHEWACCHFPKSHVNHWLFEDIGKLVCLNLANSGFSWKYGVISESIIDGLIRFDYLCCTWNDNSNNVYNLNLFV